MTPGFRRWLVICLAVLCIVLFLQSARSPSLIGGASPHPPNKAIQEPTNVQGKIRWRDVHQFHPVETLMPLPTQEAVSIPKIQAEFEPEGELERLRREERLLTVQKAMKHSWAGYKRYAWLYDEVGPVSGEGKNTLGGWAATLVDSLDTLWIIGMKQDFENAVRELKGIDFTSTKNEELNVFETNIRYLGGLLSAYDVSGQKYQILLDKAVDLGDMLLAAFDTPHRMPVVHWYWNHTLYGWEMEGMRTASLAEVGSFSLEFTRLSQLTGDSRWYDAIARINNVFAEQQDMTHIPGLWPVSIDTMHAWFSLDRTFTLSGLADSFYEYLPKQHLLLSGRVSQYREMYLKMLPAAKKNLFFRPMNPQNRKILMSGSTQRHAAVSPDIIPEIRHITCYLGGMVALGAKLFDQPQELETARQLVDGCLWAYKTMPSGIMPDNFYVAPCKDDLCEWSEDSWLDAVALQAQKVNKPLMDRTETWEYTDRKRLPPGITNIVGSQYYLRPEAIESIFVLYRITGDKKLQDEAWDMFKTIVRATRTDIAYASLLDVREPADSKKTFIDEMESFWTAATLKYFYLIFTEPDVVSLDDYVFNTEAHPLLRPK